MASCFQLLMSASLSAAECPGVDFCCPIIAEYFFPTDEMVGGLLSSLKKRAFLTSRIKFIPLSLEFKGSCHQTPIQSLLKIFAQIPLMLFGNPDPPLPSGRLHFNPDVLNLPLDFNPNYPPPTVFPGNTSLFDFSFLQIPLLYQSVRPTLTGTLARHRSLPFLSCHCWKNGASTYVLGNDGSLGVSYTP